MRRNTESRTRALCSVFWAVTARTRGSLADARVRSLPEHRLEAQAALATGSNKAPHKLIWAGVLRLLLQ